MLRRVLLVEDDDAIQRYVTMALDELPIELVTVGTLADAWRRLEAEAFDLMLTDLMLPDGHGADLVQRIAMRPGHSVPLRWVAFSAGISAPMRSRLEALGVWRILEKPVAIGELLSCVEQALATSPSGAAPGTAPDALPARPDDGNHAPRTLPANEAAAMAEHFGDQAELFAAFKAASVAQFSADLERGDNACASGDIGALHHLGHSLKSVLQLLGHPHAGQRARLLEVAAAAREGPRSTELWLALRAELLGIVGGR